jgi:hypothetical protein
MRLRGCEQSEVCGGFFRIRHRPPPLPTDGWLRVTQGSCSGCDAAIMECSAGEQPLLTLGFQKCRSQTSNFRRLRRCGRVVYSNEQWGGHAVMKRWTDAPHICLRIDRDALSFRRLSVHACLHLPPHVFWSHEQATLPK